jgi:hypothetical protein
MSLNYFVIDFGDDDIETLSEHYKPTLESAGVNLDEVPVEWTHLKTEIYNR